jgi:hypothetical protein
MQQQHLIPGSSVYTESKYGLSMSKVEACLAAPGTAIRARWRA